MRTWQLVAGSAVAGLALAVSAVVAAGPWDSGQRKAERDRAASAGVTGGADHGGGGLPQAAPSAPGVLPGLAPGGARPATAPAALAAALKPLLADPALGAARSASVVDAASGTVLYADGAADPMTPASTVKIVTAVAALAALGPEHRIATRVVPGAAPGTIVLVGGGDPSLSARKKNPAGPGGSLVVLAGDTAQALKAAGTTTVTLGFDDSLYTGPARHPIGRNPNLAPVSALTADEGRPDDSVSGPVDRTDTPAEDAAATFATLLRERGIEVTGGTARTKAPAGAEPLAVTHSTPVAGLVERMLTHSDNDIAEALARQTALASGQPASFEGGEKAVAAKLAGLGMDLSGTRFADGSGLNRADKVSAGLLTALLAKAADPARPELRPVLTGLPVAGFTGTLRARNAGTSPAAGLLRAKTGTLSGVNSLAGTVVDPSGRLLVFAFLASDTPGAEAAEKALDRLASAVATTGGGGA
ncbi:D-alanyl-D-alanine carboxypeptidase/D-alanyl-D-alanine endopeptidase [Streptomyces antimicrobicus]|uniref:D-alanyl-D-alanine carboxypeptidase/D-alanyl-D-alanine-endopeptidase n=1 Tax=Streptomyces antimicrobicus TaxID=2883108 RepID=A0ABS8BC71_9ACTN|nr:D-alanyl-D-alanine carboxypeptidase/D-alanyl-D-alanine-endopeptidase [Streptomyces antimicrobicus]MCB5182222.1 D-alanyl-D-alanine carboxypeptidase/D-alanyl-D-alanine-endopeptidase [Streptomyces antimicrobicus]